MHPTSADWQAAGDLIGAGNEAKDTGELLSLAMPLFKELFHADVVAWTTYGTDTAVTGYRMYPAIEVGHLFVPFLKYFHEHPLYHRLAELLSRGHAALLSDEIVMRDLLRTNLWNEVYIHLQAKHQIAIVGPSDCESFWSLSLNRVGRDYGPRDRALVQFLRPHLQKQIEGVARAKRMEMLAGTLHRFFHIADSPYVWVDSRGIVREVAPAAQRLLPRTTEPLVAGHALPPAIQGAFTRLQSSRPAARRFVTVRIGPVDGVLLALGETEGALFLLQPNENPVVQVALTRRETEILRWLGEGKTNREIGRVCGISVRTVGRHCENLFAKLGVDSRVAAALLSRDLVLDR